MIEVVTDDPLVPDCVALLNEAQALQASLYPDNNHSLSTEALAAPDIRFFAARENGKLLGVAALAVRKGYGEVKSMFAAPAARGRGVGRALLQALEQEARQEGLNRLCLETGAELAAACRLYRSQGFVDRGAFGSYIENGSSVFMEKKIG